MLPVTESWQVLYILSTWQGNTIMSPLGLRVKHIQRGAEFGLSEIGCMRCGVALEPRELALGCLLHMGNQQKNMSRFSTRLE